MAKGAKNDLVHSVAFRVTESQWLKLQQQAEIEGTSIPQLAKAAVFEKIGVQPPTLSTWTHLIRAQHTAQTKGMQQGWNASS